MTRLMDIFGKQYKIQFIDFLLTTNGKIFTITDLAKGIQNNNYNSLRNTIYKMIEEGYIIVDRIHIKKGFKRNKIYYKINMKNPLLKELIIFRNKIHFIKHKW